MFYDGPLHPDLFGGETPIRLQCGVELAAYQVQVSWSERRSKVVRVIAEINDDDEAIEAAQDAFEASVDSFDAEDVDAESLGETGAPPTNAEIKAYLAAHGDLVAIEEVLVC